MFEHGAARGEIPYLTTDQMIEVDRLMIEDYRIELIQMMESAGRNLAHLSRVRFFDGDPRGKKVVVLAGTGGNGGGAMVAGRRLSNWGAEVWVFVTRPASEFKGVPGHQLEILRGMGVPCAESKELGELATPALILDGIIGYSLTGTPHGAARTLIEWANASSAPTLSLDVPSGLDTTHGRALDPAVRATATMTLALPKIGLRGSDAGEVVGELYLADIGVPPALYGAPSLGLEVGALFSGDEIIRLA
jgi:NAD(P)H-hydrate epimerase